MKSYKEFREQYEISEMSERTTIVVIKRGLGWEARFPAVSTMLGVGQDPIEAVKNLWIHPSDTGEDWEREDRLNRFRMNQNS